MGNNLSRRELRLHSYKHLRGRHDQRDHNRWPAGYQAQGYIPTGGGRRAGLLSSRATGGVAGITQQNIMMNQDLVGEIKEFQKERDVQRLPLNFDMSPYKEKFDSAGSGATGVKKVQIGNEIYFYRDTPGYFGAEGFETANENWFVMPGLYFPLIADSLSSAMGVNVAPLAQLSSNERVITSDIGIEVSKGPKWYMQSRIEDIKTGNLSREESDKIRYEMEPYIALSLIIGQGDGHWGNVSVVRNSPNSVLDTEYMIATVDTDFSGAETNTDNAVGLFFDELLKGRPVGEGIFSPRMEEILRLIPQTIEWHPAITRDAKNQILSRVRALIQANEDYKNHPLSIDEITEKMNVAATLNRGMLKLRDTAISLQDTVQQLDESFEYTQQVYDMVRRNNGDDVANEIFEQVVGKKYDTYVQEQNVLHKEILDVSRKILVAYSPQKLQALLRKKQIIDWKMNPRNSLRQRVNAFESLDNIIIEQDANIKDVNDIWQEVQSLMQYFVDEQIFITHESFDEYTKMNNAMNRLMSYSAGLAFKNKKLKKFAEWMNKTRYSMNPHNVLRQAYLQSKPELIDQFMNMIDDIKKAIKK